MIRKWGILTSTIAFVLLTFIFTGLGVYLFMNQIVMPREIAKALDREPLLRPAEVQGLVVAHATQIKVQIRPGDTQTMPLSQRFAGDWNRRYQNGKWVVSVSSYSFVVDDKTGKVTGP